MKSDKIGGEFDPTTAHFWGSFQSEPGQQKRHTHMLELYSTAKEERFFIIQTPPDGPARKQSAEPSQGALFAEVFEDREELEKWLKERCDFILHYAG